MRTMNAPSRRAYGTVIIGGGIAGVGLAYYLAAQGQTDIVVVEANELANQLANAAATELSATDAADAAE